VLVVAVRRRVPHHRSISHTEQKQNETDRQAKEELNVIDTPDQFGAFIINGTLSRDSITNVNKD
jgi:predicted nicotinamide N-methyase